MMQKTFILAVVFMMVLAHGVSGQAVIHSQNRTRSAFPTLSSTFSNSTLSLPQLESFSGRAAQKLMDLEGYLNILGNPEYEDVFREQAEEMIQSEFHEGDLTLEHPYSRSPISLSSFLNFFSIGEYTEFFVPTFAEIDEGPTPYWHDDGYYAGQLVFHFTLKRINNEEVRSEEKALWYKIDYRIEQRMKQFGETEKPVWEVRLGSMSKN